MIAVVAALSTAEASELAKPWGAELDVVQPFYPTVHILRPKVTRTLWGAPGEARGDLIAGVYLRPHIAHDVLYTIDEYLAVVGYRQYVWRGLHVEGMLDSGVAWGTNRLDQRDYFTPSVFVDLNAGYRFTLFDTDAVAPYVAVQGGVLLSAGVADIGPRNGKPDNFPQAMLLVGTAF